MSRRLDDSGAVMLEFAMVLPVMTFLILGAIDLLRATHAGGWLDFAVQAASRCGAIVAAPCPTLAATMAYAVNAAQYLPGATFDVTRPACGVQVDGSYVFEPMVLQVIPITSSACYPVAP